MDSDQPLVNVRTMEQSIGSSVAQPRLQTTLVIICAAVAAALAIIGVYGVMASAVSHRTQEIGVRIALGASHGDVVAMVVRQGVALTASGIVIGPPRWLRRARSKACCTRPMGSIPPLLAVPRWSWP